MYDQSEGRDTYTANTLNQYTTVGSTAQTYDANGNLTNDGTTAFTYDEENRLTTATKTGLTASYGYDAFNRRISKTVNGTTEYFVYDNEDIIEDRTSTGTLTADYVHGSQIDEILTMTRSGNTYYYHHDALGSVTEITNNSGTLVENYTYDVYGQPSVITSAISNRYRFTGREYDEETGLYHYRNRTYSPTIGRFLQRDTIEYYDSTNLYQCVLNSPVNWVDPWGLSPDLVGVTDGNGNAVFDPNPYLPPLPNNGGKSSPCPKKGLSRAEMEYLMEMVMSVGPGGAGKVVVRGGKKAAKEALKRLKTIGEHWKYYRNPRDIYDKIYKRDEIRELIRRFRERFGRKK